MTKDLTRYNLEYKKSMVYLSDQLLAGNTLSHELLNMLNFGKGQFYTLLPNDAALEKIYEFSSGGVLPQNEILEGVNNSGQKYYYSETPTIKNELSEFIMKKMMRKDTSICLFEDVVRLPTYPHLEFFHKYGLVYSNEIYYFLRKDMACEETIISAINKANSLWHLLFIVTELEDSDSIEQSISLENIRSFCCKIKLLILGAYDGEAYLLWEPQQ